MLFKIKKVFWIFILVIFLAILFLPGYTKLQELRDKNADLEVKIRKLEIENTLLQEQSRRLGSDPIYQERILREKMGIVREGEVPVKIIQEGK